MKSKIYTFSLFDITGKQAYVVYVYNGIQLVDLPILANGLYFYRISVENSIMFTAGKLMINN